MIHKIMAQQIFFGISATILFTMAFFLLIDSIFDKSTKNCSKSRIDDPITESSDAESSELILDDQLSDPIPADSPITNGEINVKIIFLLAALMLSSLLVGCYFYGSFDAFLSSPF